ncbi:MAG: hypothetical protein GXP55_15410 [Deltaproteobacteria bacterium]|nr:hypothetical protein [Deltaproteobacteria bacterium]
MQLAKTPRSSTLLAETLRSSDLMSHEIDVVDIDDRREWLSGLCAGKSVLHVGCCDVPIFDPNNNLHIFLSKHTSRLDGLDISEPGIALLRRHVDGMYFTDPSRVTREYDIVLVPEVLEHTANPGQFLTGIFSIRAEKYLVTAPHIQWYERTQRRGATFCESVHGDHKAWYSPYTLLNTLRPFIDEQRDGIEVFLLTKTGSVGALVSKPIRTETFEAMEPPPTLEVEQALTRAEALASDQREAAALRLLAAARQAHADARLVHAELRILLALGRSMDALRRGIPWLGQHARDVTCRGLCADAMESLGDRERAEKLRCAPDSSR